MNFHVLPPSCIYEILKVPYHHRNCRECHTRRFQRGMSRKPFNISFSVKNRINVSKEPEIDWGLVAKKIIAVLGEETARGLYYGILIQGVTPALIEKVRELASGRRSGEDVDRIRREILEAYGRWQLPPQIQSQMALPQSPLELERALAQAFAQAQYRGGAGYQYPVSSYPPPALGPQPTRPPVHPFIQQEIESLRNELRNLEDIRNSLVRKKYETFDEATVRQIDERIREVESKISEIKLRLQRLEVTQTGWP